MVLPKLEQHRFAANAPSTELMSPSFFYSQIYIPVQSSHHWLNAQFGTLVGAKPDQLEHILISVEVRKILVYCHCIGCSTWVLPVADYTSERSYDSFALSHGTAILITGLLFYSLKN